MAPLHRFVSQLFLPMSLRLSSLIAGLILGLSCQFAAAQLPRVVLPAETSWTAAPGSGATPVVTLPPETAMPGAQAAATPAVQAASAPATAQTNRDLDRILVGAGDQIFIAVFGQPDMSAEVTVNDNGQVTLPLIGTLRVGNLPPQAIERLVTQRLKDGEYLRNPEVSVQIRQLRSQVISVLGEVQRPGRFPLQGRHTVLDALATAGGLTARADRTVLVIRRPANPTGDANARQEISIDLDQLVDKNRGDLDFELRNEDVVFVAQQKFFYVHGEVRRPGAYPMEHDLNVMRALSIGGGVTERGSIKRLKIHRTRTDKSLEILTPDLTTPLLSGDVLHVDERLF